MTAFVAATTETSGVDDPQWRKACPKELAAIGENKTFLLVDVPADKDVVGCRWVFTFKSGHDGSVEMAGLAAEGSSRIRGIYLR